MWFQIFPVRRTCLKKLLWLLPLLVLAPIVLSAMPAQASPPGIEGKKLYNFNLIAVPHNWASDPTVCNNNGSRIFFKRPANGNGSLGTLTWNLDPTANNFDITDCNATD